MVSRPEFPLRAISALADAGLLLPASAGLILLLLARRELRAAGAVALSLGACGAATVAAKLLFRACGANLTGLDIVSPSGHASFATAFYGALAILVGTGRAPAVRAALAAATVLLLAAIGASRVLLGDHSSEEVLLGYAIGAAAVAGFAVLHARAGRPALPVLPLAVGFALALAVVGGRPFTLEGGIARAAGRIASTLDVCADGARRSRAWPGH